MVSNSFITHVICPGIPGYVCVEYINLIGATVDTVKHCQLEWNVYAAMK